jgi:chemotaxis signal transduction protein
MSRELAKTLAVLQQLVENVDAVIPLDRISAAEIRRHPAASQLDTWLTGIWRWDNELRPLLDDILLAQRIPMTEVPAKLSAFFHETYPRSDKKSRGSE